MDVSWLFLPHSSTSTAPGQDSAASQDVWTLPLEQEPIPWPGAAGRDGTGLDPEPAGLNFPQGLRVPFPSTDCTDTNFILQVLKPRSLAQPPCSPPCGEGAEPALPMVGSPCGAGCWGPPATGALSPHLSHPAGLSLLPAPVLGALSSLRAHPASTFPPVKPVQDPQGWGLSPRPPHPNTSQAPSPIPQGLRGHSGDWARDSDHQQGGGWQGGLWGAQNCMAPLGSHCSRRTMDGSLLAPLMNSSSESFPSLLVSICRKILSVLFSGVDSSSGMFMTEETIL